jgi:formylglycine-generating enzyme required for sulfatase activity
VNTTRSATTRRPAVPVVGTSPWRWLMQTMVVWLLTMSCASVTLADTRRAMEAEARMHGAPMVWISDGVFTMGSTTGRHWNQPPHEIYVNAFYLDQFEVTVARYAKFLDAAESSRQGLVPKLWEQVNMVNDGDRPVIGVSWHAADAYCRWAQKRLPTEAEWEKAARATDRRTYPWGNKEPTFAFANYAQPSSGNTYSNGLRPVGSYEAGKSPYGVYDMAGNASEWVSDWYDEGYYATSPKNNPQGPNRGLEKVMRGGSFQDSSLSMKSVSRDSSFPHDKGRLVGVRCAQDAF